MKKHIVGLLLLSFSIIQCSLPEITDVTPPTIAVVYPYEGAVISADVEVQILAVDTDAIEKVWYYVDGQKMAETTSSPYSLPLSINGLTKNVAHVLMAAAQDENGNSAYSAPVSFTIAETEDIIPPSVAIVNPVSGQVVEGIVNITAHAQDERSIQKVYFYIDGLLADSSSAYPYMANWNTVGISDSTSHTIFAKAIDGGNNESISPVIQVTVYPRTGEAGDNGAPNAIFLYPVSGLTITGNVEVSVDLFDDTAVSSAEFYVDGQLEETSVNNPASPWIFTWDSSAKADASTHTLYVKAYDAAGNVGTTGLIQVIIE